MVISQHSFINGTWSDNHSNGTVPDKYQLVLVFGDRETIGKQEILDYLKTRYPVADIVFASTAGEIINETVYDESVVATAIAFEKTRVRCIEKNLNELNSSFETGKALMSELNEDDLAGVFVISDGTRVNGSELVAGFNEKNTKHIPVTGGLAGDGARFVKTLTGMNNLPAEGNIIGIGLYGNDILIGHGSLGGWDEFGRERTITKSDKNILYEIDNESALKLYKEYLGDYVNELPGSALLFPLALKTDGSDGKLVRTILGIDEEKDSMTFAGNMPVGSKVRLMKANFDRLIEGSSNAASKSFVQLKDHKPDLAIMVSCVGRKLILQQRVTEEVEAAREILGEQAVITGFYSYGEISPLNPGTNCELHNQTMTITSFTEL